jgi:molecular chaperone GrpE (heat shock protein)
MVSLQERLASAEATASAADSRVGASQDQLIRLQADFENFRKRTVRAEGGGGEQQGGG